MKIFVAGGTGFVGRHIVEELQARGHAVRLLVHRRTEGARAGREEVAGDATDAASLAGKMSGCDAVINLVGIIREFPSRGISFRALHPGVTQNMVLEAKRAGVPRFLQMSAQGTRRDAVSDYHRTKYEAEEWVRSSGIPFTIFRPSIIFGPGDAFVTMLADYVKRYPAVPIIGKGDYRLQPVFVRDVARCFADSLEMPATVGETYSVCGPQRFRYVEMVQHIGAALGRKKVTCVNLPLALMKLVVPLLQNIPSFPLTTDQMLMLLEENICDGRWRETFTFEPTSFDAGIRSYLS